MTQKCPVDISCAPFSTMQVDRRLSSKQSFKSKTNHVPPMALKIILRIDIYMGKGKDGGSGEASGAK